MSVKHELLYTAATQTYYEAKSLVLD